MVAPRRTLNNCVANQEIVLYNFGCLASTIKVDPIERLDDSAFQAVPVPQIRNTSDLNRELAELLKGTGPLSPAWGKESVPVVKCPDCGSLSSPDDLFCLACGALLGEA